MESCNGWSARVICGRPGSNTSNMAMYYTALRKSLPKPKLPFRFIVKIALVKQHLLLYQWSHCPYLLSQCNWEKLGH